MGGLVRTRYLCYNVIIFEYLSDYLGMLSLQISSQNYAYASKSFDKNPTANSLSPDIE